MVPQKHYCRINGAFSAAFAAVFGLFLAFSVVEVAAHLYPTSHTCRIDYPLIYSPDEETGYRYIPGAEGVYRHLCVIDNRVLINGHGFHDIERELLPGGGKTRILAIGDSHTAAIEVGAGETWAQVAEGLLGRDRVEVLNMGIDGTGTDAHVNLLRQYAGKLNPDIVLLAFGKNDIQDVRNSLVYREVIGENIVVYENAQQRDRLVDFLERNQPGKVINWLGRYSHLVRFVAGYVPALYSVKSNYISPSRVGMRVERGQRDSAIENLFEEFLEMSAEYGFRFVVVPVPYRQGPAMSHEALRENVSPRLYERLEILDLSVPMVEGVASDGNEWGDVFFRKDGHYNQYGHSVFGVLLADGIGTMLNVPHDTGLAEGGPNLAERRLLQ